MSVFTIMNRSCYIVFSFIPKTAFHQFLVKPVNCILWAHLNLQTILMILSRFFFNRMKGLNSIP